MRTSSIVLAAALVATAAVADEKTKPAENTNQPPSADSHEQESKASKDSKETKGYGYGEQPGQEAKGSSARQASDPERPKSRAPQDQRPSPGGARAQGKGASVAGRIVSVSPESVSVRGEDRKEQSLTVTPGTVVLREGQRIDVSRLRPGDDVRASVERRGQRRVATRITVESGDASMQQGKAGDQSVDTPDQEREGISGRMEDTRPEPEKGGPEAPPSGR
jgi:hypothetical protein